MNKHILFVMRSLDNPELFTQEEKEANNRNADDAAAYAADAADAAYAAYAVYAATDAAADAAAYAAYVAYAAYAAYATYSTYATVEYWINKFFKSTGEDKQVYINEVERLKEDKTMNKHILFVMRSLDNPELFTQEEKEANNRNAHVAAADAAAYATYAAAVAAADAAAYATYAAYAADDKVISKIDHWVSRYFQTTGEDRQEYINEVERLRG